MRQHWQLLRLPSSFMLKAGALGYQRAAVLLTASLLAILYLCLDTFFNASPRDAGRSVADLALILLLAANLAWLYRSHDLASASSIYLTILFGQNNLAILHGYYGSVGLFVTALYPWFAFTLQGWRGGAMWSLLMGFFLLFYYIGLESGLVLNNVSNAEFTQLLVNFAIVALACAIHWALHAKQQQQQQQHDHLQYLANHDTLTGLLNRNAFLRQLEVTMEHTFRYNGNFALMFLDLDRFKQINDHLGHNTGDRILAMAAKRIEHAVRASDLVARYGGDEFLILLQNIEPKYAKAVLNKIERQFEIPFEVSGETITVGISIGVSFCPHDSASVAELIHHADKEMYSYKLERRANTG